MFEHKQMAKVSDDRRRALQKHAGKKSIEGRLFQVAFSFFQLQQKRESADYDGAVTISRHQARIAVAQAEEAFTNWEQIRHEQIAHDYLYSLLIRERATTRTPEWG